MTRVHDDIIVITAITIRWCHHVHLNHPAVHGYATSIYSGMEHGWVGHVECMMTSSLLPQYLIRWLGHVYIVYMWRDWHTLLSAVVSVWPVSTTRILTQKIRMIRSSCHSRHSFHSQLPFDILSMEWWIEHLFVTLWFFVLLEGSFSNLPLAEASYAW